MKPKIVRACGVDTELGRGLGFQDTWVVRFPPSGDCVDPETGEEIGAVWFAGDCEYVRASIAAWYRDGLEGLSQLHNKRYGRAA
jgi:hypothetical protein